MFRPTHFAILFAVVLCANAFPAAPSAPLPGGPIKGQAEPGLAQKQPAHGPLRPNKDAPATKGDLDTDATEYWGYRYNDFYGSRWATYEPDYYVARTYGWPLYYY